MILAVTTVAVATAAIWAWHENSQPANARMTRAEGPPSTQVPPSTPATSEEVPAAPTPTASSTPAPAEPTPAPTEDNQSAKAANVAPQSLDTPEPAERKFARGGRADPDQN
jgi:hypothetical protein